MPESIPGQEAHQDATRHPGSLGPAAHSSSDHPGPLGPPPGHPAHSCPPLYPHGSCLLSLLTVVPLFPGPWFIPPVNKQAGTSPKSLQMFAQFGENKQGSLGVSVIRVVGTGTLCG